jgi:hypothetical protein
MESATEYIRKILEGRLFGRKITCAHLTDSTLTLLLNDARLDIKADGEIRLECDRPGEQSITVYTLKRKEGLTNE